MKVKIIIEKNKENQLGRCGFQIQGVNKKHLEAYIPQIKTKTSKESLYIMHSIMKAVIYSKKNLQRLQYILFQLPNIPKATSKEWKVMQDFNKRLLPNIKIEYTKA